MCYLQPLCPNAFATGDPHAALEAANAGQVDSMVLDLMMPELDGLKLLTLLRESAATAALPVLACSSKTLTSTEHRLLAELRAPFLSKDDLGVESLLKGLVDARAFSRLEASPGRRPTGAMR